MKELIILNRQFPTQTYTFNVFFPEIEDEDELQNFLISCYRSKDCVKLGQYLDVFSDYIYDIIDEVDYFYIYTTDKELCVTYMNNLNHEEYIENKNETINVFDIRDKYSKEWLKNHLTYNISDEDRFALEFNLKRSYLANDEKMDEFNYIHFVKDNRLIVNFSRYCGYIFDFRDNDVIEKHKEKYRSLNKK